ncbi:MAG: nucleotide exchange factor GrpE [Bacteroidales bacterium]
MAEEKKEKGFNEAEAKDQNHAENENANGRDASKNQENNKHSSKKKFKTNNKNHVKELEKKVDELEENLADLNDKYLRLFSEFDNYRKRTMKERLELTKTASQEVIIDLLPVLDDFERAIKAIESQEGGKGNAEGIKLIYNKFNNILGRKGLTPMKSIGETFDTDFHEAVTNIPAPAEDQKGKVVDEIEKGYLLNGKVIRFAKVVVGQ